MQIPPRPPDERQRLAELHSLNLIDTGPDHHFDVVTELASRHFDVPIALVTLIDRDHQWFKSCIGLDGNGTTRDESFCTYTILKDELLIVEDAFADPRFADNPLVLGDPFIRFYAGRPIHGPTGKRLGSLCVIDRKPREFSEADREYLDLLGELIDRDLQDAELTETFRRVAQSGAVMDLFFEASPTLLCVLDADLHINRANPTWTSALGWSSEELAGRGLLSLVHPDDVAMVAHYFENPAHPADDEAPEARLMTKNGHLKWVSFRPVGSNTEGVMFLTARDVTAARAIQEQRDRIIGVVSHELRSPLAAIHGTVEMLEDGDFGTIPDTIRRPIRSISRNSSRMLELANDLVDLERLEAGGIPLNESSFSLAELLDDCVARMSDVCRQAGVGLTMTADDSACTADRARLEQVLVNLIGNAVKFSPKGSQIELTGGSDSTATAIHVRDHGRGIPDDLLPVIFDRFRQSDIKDATFGAGLGLAIARGLVEQHGGTLGVESELDVGTTFTMTLPRQQTEGDVLPAQRSNVDAEQGVS